MDAGDGAAGRPSAPGRGCVSWAAEGEHAKFLVSVRDDWQLWPQLEPHVGGGCFPIRDYTWIQDAEFRTPIPVACLDIRCLAHSSAYIDSGAPPSRWWKRPFLYLFLAKCEDAVAYKEGVKDRIRTWVADRAAAGDEYLVLYLPLGSAKTSSSYLYLTSPSSAMSGEAAAGKIYRKLFEKMRSDVKQAERVVLFDLSLHSEVATSADTQTLSRHVGEVPYDAKVQATNLGNRLREALLSSIAARITEYEERIARAHGARQAEGWDFRAAFLPRDAIALMYRSMGAVDSALRQYRAWGEYFDEFVTAQPTPRFPHFEPRALPEGAQLTDPLDLSSHRPSLDLASSGGLCELEFRLFVLGREVRLLADAKRLTQAAQTALSNIRELSAEAASRQEAPGITPLLPVSITVSCAEWCARDMHRRIDSLSEWRADGTEGLTQQASGAKRGATESEVKAAHCAVAELYLMAATSASALIKSSPQLQRAHRRSKSTGSATSSHVSTPVGDASGREDMGRTDGAGAKWGGGHEHVSEGEASHQQGAMDKRERPRSSGSWLPAKVSSLISGPGNRGMSRALSTIRRPTWVGWEKDVITQSVRGAYNRGMASFPFNDSPDTHPSSSSASSLAPPSTATSSVPPDSQAFPSPMSPSLVAPTLLFRFSGDSFAQFELAAAQEVSALEQMQSGPLADAIACGGIQDYWLGLTSAARDHLLAGGRPRCANYLVLEMAEAHMQRQRWGEAGELLRYAFEQLIADAWNPLLSRVYEPLCQCLQVLGEDAALLALALALLSCPSAPEPLRSSAASMLRDLPSQMAGDGLVHEMGGLFSVSLQLPKPPPLPTCARQASAATSAGVSGKEGEDTVEIDLGDGIVLTSTRVLFEDSDAADDHTDATSRWDAYDPSSPAREGWESRRHVVPVGCDLVIECNLDNRLPCDFKVDAVALALFPLGGHGVGEAAHGNNAGEGRDCAASGDRKDQTESTKQSGAQDGQDAETTERDSVLRAVLEAAGDEQEHTGLLLLEKKDVVIMPGRNSITLTAPMMHSRRFLLTALTLRSGKLILAHSLRRDTGDCTVEGRRGIPSAQLSVSAESEIVQGVPTLTKTTLRAGEGGTRDTEVRLFGKPNGIVVHSKCCWSQGVNDSGVGDEHSDGLASMDVRVDEVGDGGWVRLPDMQPGEIVTVWFGVFAETQANGSHKLFAEMRYRGAQGAVFGINQQAGVEVLPPFTVRSHVVQTASGDRVLKLILQCVPLHHHFQLQGVQVTCEGQELTEAHLSSTPGAHISLVAGSTLHFVYFIARVQADEPLEGEVCARYVASWTDPLLSQIVGETSGERFSTVGFLVDDLGPPVMRIAITTPPSGVMGRAISASMRFVHPVPDQQGRPLKYHFALEPEPVWLLAGKTTGVWDSEEISFSLVPLKCGVLSPPLVELLDSNCKIECQVDPVVVLPCSNWTSTGLVRTQASQ